MPCLYRLTFSRARRRQRSIGRRRQCSFRRFRGNSKATEATVENIIKKLDKVPFPEIGVDLQKAITQLDKTLVTAQGTLVVAQGTFDNTTSLTGPNSSQVEQVDSTLQEVSRAARSLRVLADYLERHPDALLRGKKGEAK